MKPFRTEPDSMGDAALEMSGLDRAKLEDLLDLSKLTEPGLMGANT